MLDLNKIYCGDNLTLIKQLDDNCIDLTVTSPPYDNLRTYNGFTWDFEGLAKELFRVTKVGGVVVWVVADATVNGSETGTSFRQALYFRGEFGDSDAEIVKSIVISWLSEKSFITSSAKQKRID